MQVLRSYQCRQGGVARSGRKGGFLTPEIAKEGGFEGVEELRILA